VRIPLTGAVVLLLAACDGAGELIDPPALIGIAHALLADRDTLVLTVPTEQRLVYALPHRHLSDRNIQWTSRSSDVAEVDGTGPGGRVTARSAGFTWAVATWSTTGQRDSVPVLVEFDTPADLPLWRFTVAVGARTDRSPAEIRDGVSVYINELNRAFNPDNVFAGRFEFVLDSLFTYPDSSAETVVTLGRRPRTAQYLVLLDSRGGQLGGGGSWFRHLQTVQIHTAKPLVDGAAVLVHEMGHAGVAYPDQRVGWQLSRHGRRPVLRPDRPRGNTRRGYERSPRHGRGC
jgi:hypothetical protein